MDDLLKLLRIEHPIIQAPMGGGPGTPALAATVSNAGCLGSLAGGYLTPEQIHADITKTRALTDRPFNVNLFAGGYHAKPDRDPAPILDVMRAIHAQFQLPEPAIPEVPPDPFDDQVEAVLEARPAVFSFTFGIPPRTTLQAFRSAEIVIIGTATTLTEAEMLAEAGVDAIVAQGLEAGAHRGTFAGAFDEALVPTLALVRQIAAKVRTPVIASGGIMTGE
jgi:nitronate monooxygenase